MRTGADDHVEEGDHVEHDDQGKHQVVVNPLRGPFQVGVLGDQLLSFLILQVQLSLGDFLLEPDSKGQSHAGNEEEEEVGVGEEVFMQVDREELFLDLEVGLALEDFQLMLPEEDSGVVVAGCGVRN